MQKILICLLISIFFCVGCATQHVENEGVLIEKRYYYLQNELKGAWEKFLIDAKQIQNNGTFKK